jgi:hypothetical protein
MPNTPDPNALMTELRAFFNTKSSVLGSQVGAFLKSRFPSFDYRTQHVNLKAFLQAIFPGEVNVIGKKGPDDILALAPASSQQPVGPIIIRDNDTQDEGIEMFRNPTLSGSLIYDLQRKQLLKSAKPVELVENCASGSLNIERMSHADQRAIMEEFAKNYSAREDTRGFERVFERDDPLYWQKFYLIVKNAKLVQNWLSFRRTKVTELLQQRLKDAGVPEGDIPGMVKQASLKGTSRRGVNSLSGSDSRGRITTRPSSLADLARTAIAHLSESQIRELKIPLGAIWDSFQEDR